MTDNLIALARSRVGGNDGFQIIGHGEVGEPSNGALILALANLLEETLNEMHSRELHHFETEKMLVEAGIDPDVQKKPAVDGEVLAKRLDSAFFDWEINDNDLRGFEYAQADSVIASGILLNAADIWNNGKIAGKSITMRRMSDEPEAPEPVNPYRAESGEST